MRWRGTWVLWLLALNPPLNAQAPGPGPREAIKACIVRASPDLKGLDALRAECPGVAQAIWDLRLDTFLPADWPKRITPAQLGDLDALAARYAGKVPGALQDPVSLQDIARRLPRPPVYTTSPWEAFKHWLGSWLQAHWSEWARFLPAWQPTVAESALLLYGLVALVVLGAVAIIASELRAAGVFEAGQRSKLGSRRPDDEQAEPAEQMLDMAQIVGAAPHLRPVLTLRWLVAALMRSSRLGHERDLTCRELITKARFDTGAQQALFSRIALLAEGALYGAAPSAQPLNDALLADAQGLHGQLLVLPPSPHA
jgi:hypothetical protein